MEHDGWYENGTKWYENKPFEVEAPNMLEKFYVMIMLLKKLKKKLFNSKFN
jgi:hypothetical protein